MTLYFDGQLGVRKSSLQDRAAREAYYALYSLAGASEADHFVFTSSAAEAVNHAIWSAYVDITRKTGKNHFLCSALDDAATMLAMQRLQQELGCVSQVVPANIEGKNSLKSIVEMITPRTAMLSMNWANPLTGVLQPIEEIAALCKERGILFHVEASNVLGKGDFSFESSGADLMSFSAPFAGAGALFIRYGVEISPLILGAAEQVGMRAGPFPMQLLIDFAKWAREEVNLIDHYGTEVSRLRALFEQLLISGFEGAEVLFEQQKRVSHITSLFFQKWRQLLFILPFLKRRCIPHWAAALFSTSATF